MWDDVAGTHNDNRRRPSLAHILCQCDTVHGAWHLDVGEYHGKKSKAGCRFAQTDVTSSAIRTGSTCSTPTRQSCWSLYAVPLAYRRGIRTSGNRRGGCGLRCPRFRGSGRGIKTPFNSGIAKLGDVGPRPMRNSGVTPKFLGIGNRLSSVARGTWSKDLNDHGPHFILYHGLTAVRMQLLSNPGRPLLSCSGFFLHA